MRTPMISYSFIGKRHIKNMLEIVVKISAFNIDRKVSKFI